MTTLALLLGVTLVGLSAALAQEPRQEVRDVLIGVVRDGPAPSIDRVPAIERELGRQVPAEVRVRFVDRFAGDWNLASVDHALQAALGDPEIDLVLLTGPLGTRSAVAHGALAKPVVSAFVSFGGLAIGGTQGDRSAIDNLAVTSLGPRGLRDLEAFRDLVGFDRVDVALDAGLAGDAADLEALVAAHERQLGVAIRVVAIGPETSDLNSLFGPDVQAVYLALLPRLTADERRALIESLTARGVPTMSMYGRPDVEQGALVGLTPDFVPQAVRRAALNLSRLIRGESTAALPVLLSVDTTLTINARTAERIGWAPDPATSLSAVWVHESVASSGEPLSVARAMRLAEEGNTALTVSDAAVEAAAEDTLFVRGRLLPQFQADVAYDKIDLDALGDADAFRGGVTLRQGIYEARAWSDYKSAKRLEASASLSREADRLDVLANAGRAFFSLALAESLYGVEVENLRITRDNLELARLRREVGYSGREEILRWESQQAQDEGNVLAAERDVQVARIELNRILGLSQVTPWILELPELEPDVFPWVGGRFAGRLTDPLSLRRFREALVEYGLRASPTVQAQGEALEAQEIRVKHLGRRYYVPDVFAGASWSDAIGGSGDSDILLQGETYAVQVGASFPIFVGGQRKHELGRASADRAGIERGLTFTREVVERDVRSQLRRLQASFPRIKLTQESAARAAENLTLVRDRYIEGLANVTDLLDAQQQKLLADQLAATARFEFESDLIELQRAIAWFEQDHDESGAAAFVAEIESTIAAADEGIQP